MEDSIANIKGFIDGAIGLARDAVALISGLFGGVKAPDVSPRGGGGGDFGSPPELARGAVVNPVPRGTIVRLAEAGRSEAVVDEGLLNRQLSVSLWMQQELEQQSAAPPAIDVQNPWTAEYHEARMVHVSDRRIGTSNDRRVYDAQRGRW